MTPYCKARSVGQDLEKNLIEYFHLNSLEPFFFASSLEEWQKPRKLLQTQTGYLYRLANPFVESWKKIVTFLFHLNICLLYDFRQGIELELNSKLYQMSQIMAALSF